MKNIFNSVKMTRPNNNVFDLTHDVKFSMDMGKLTPVMLMECVPGDKVKLGCEALIKFAPMSYPVMHRFDCTIHYFFVPWRIIFKNFEKWIADHTGTLVQFPTITLDPNNPDEQLFKLMDYLGCPPPTNQSMVVSALPLAAYTAIYDEYYRDQNLIEKINYLLEDGDQYQNDAIRQYRTRAWEHDYFTSCLPFAQKGDAVSIPLGDVRLRRDAGQFPTGPGYWANMQGLDQGGDVTSSGGTTQVGGQDAVYDPDGTLEVGSTTINDLRRAFRLQEWLEKAARGGTRYAEIIRSFFGFSSSDARLQRPEYITGVKSPIIISEVLSTSANNDLALGDYAGHGVGVLQGSHGSYFCQEHGYIMGIMSVMPKTAYQDGVPRHFLKTDMFQIYWPQFAHLGEQEVWQMEIYSGTGEPKKTFGYVPRYAEYKYLPSRVAGDFRTTLKDFHIGRIFANEPQLNQEFIECNPGKRIFSVTQPNQDSLYCHVLNKVTAVRPMPKYGTPTF